MSFLGQHLLVILLLPLLDSQLSSLVVVLMLVGPRSDFFSNLGLDLGRILDRIGRQDLHQIGQSHWISQLRHVNSKAFETYPLEHLVARDPSSAYPSYPQARLYAFADASSSVPSSLTSSPSRLASCRQEPGLGWDVAPNA